MILGDLMASKLRRTVLKSRRMPLGLQRSNTRTLILDAAEQLMRDKGYAAVTTRRLGAAADVKMQLVHYYFPSMDKLFIALFARRAERNLQAATEAFQSDQPLRVLWQRNRDATDAALRAEFMALAHHRKELRVEIATFTEQIRRLQYDALVRHLEARKLNPELDPRVITVLMAAVGMLIAREEELGVTFGHAQTEAAVEAAMAAFEAGVLHPERTPKGEALTVAKPKVQLRSRKRRHPSRPSP
jgi:AcrR family transcriptional regulator